MKVAVIGLGRFGLALAEELRPLNSVHLIAVDREETLVASLNHDEEWVQHFDDWDLSSLADMGIDASLDAAVVAIGEDAEEAQRWVLALLEARVKRILARAQGATQARIMERLLTGPDSEGMKNRVIRPEAEAAHRLSLTLGHPGLQELLELDSGDAVATVDLPERFVGRSVAELSLPSRYHLNILRIRSVTPEEPDAEPRPVSAETVLAEGDELIVLGHPEDVASFVAGS